MQRWRRVGALPVAWALVLAPAVAAQEDPVASAGTGREGRGAAMAPELAAVAVHGAAVDAATERMSAAGARAEAAVSELRSIGDRLVALGKEREARAVGVERAAAAVGAAEARLDAAHARLGVARDDEQRARARLARARAQVADVAVDAYVRRLDLDAPLLSRDRHRILDVEEADAVGAAVTEDKVALAVERRAALDRAQADRDRAARGVQDAQDVLTAAGRRRRDAEDALAAVRRAVATAERDRGRQAGVVARTADAYVAAATDVSDARVLSTVTSADFPLVALDAYWRAAAAAPCPARWWALAGIGRTESRHGTFGGSALDAAGQTTKPIIGIALDGTDQTAVITDTDQGQMDGDTAFDRAVGPMQFIPSTWVRWATDGNGDGSTDPHNLYDAAATAARYLCAASGDLTTDAGLRRAYLAYNRSTAYVAIVLERARGYQARVTVAAPPSRD